MRCALQLRKKEYERIAMPVVKLTQDFIDNELRCPEGLARVEFCSAELPGLYVLVSAAGQASSYFLRYKDANGKTCHQKLGRVCDIDLNEARKRCKELKASIALGADPRAEAKARKEVMTVRDLF